MELCVRILKEKEDERKERRKRMKINDKTETMKGGEQKMKKNMLKKGDEEAYEKRGK
jgi:hypothetical protein